jgi:hypothetical protein
MVHPILLIRHHIIPQELLDHQVDPLSLSIGLGAEHNAHLEFWPHSFPQGSLKLACELWVRSDTMSFERPWLSQPYFGQVWGWSLTLGKSEDLESFGTPECLGFDSKAQSTSHWGVFGVIGKVLKRRYRKWPRIGHLDICRPSYGQKKGRESNCQFDSRPLKVGNRSLPEVRIGIAIRR